MNHACTLLWNYAQRATNQTESVNLSTEIHHHRHHRTVNTHTQYEQRLIQPSHSSRSVIRERAEIIIIFLPLHTVYDIFMCVINKEKKNERNNNRLANKAKQKHNENNDLNDFGCARVVIFRVLLLLSSSSSSVCYRFFSCSNIFCV